MNNLRRYPAIVCSLTVCKPSGIRIGSQLKTRSSCNIIPRTACLDACLTIVTAHSTPLNHCPPYPNGGTVPLTQTRANQYSTHPELRSYEKRVPKVSRGVELFDLPRLHCWNIFAKHAVVRGGDTQATHRPLRTRISAVKEQDTFLITRSDEELPEGENLFASRNLLDSFNWTVHLPVSVPWDWLSVCNLKSYFLEQRSNFSVAFVKDCATPATFLSTQSVSKPVDKQQRSVRSIKYRKRLLSVSADLQRGFFRPFHCRASPAMAKSKFEYVRQFEADDPCLPNCWVVVRIDGKAFHKFTDAHHYMKPNDERGLSLMTRAAQTVMSEFNEIVLSYGQSDEYSFVFHKNCKLYNRRASKIMTNVVSLFASSFTLFWPRFFNSQDLQYPPSFDGRVVLYPSDDNLKDYLSWRQADCHINNLYNTCFWKLVQEKGLTPNRAAERLKGTLSSDKNELLFSEFSINYNNLPELYRKGSVLIRPKNTSDGASPSPERSISNHTRGHDGKASKKPGSIVLHTDIIGKQFWEENPHILHPKI